MISRALRSFGRVLAALRAIAPDLRGARVTLRQLHPVIQSVSQLHVSCQPVSQADEGSNIVDKPAQENARQVVVPEATDFAQVLNLGQDSLLPDLREGMDDGTLRMMFTPAFDMHTWDSHTTRNV